MVRIKCRNLDTRASSGDSYLVTASHFDCREYGNACVLRTFGKNRILEPRERLSWRFAVPVIGKDKSITSSCSRGLKKTLLVYILLLSGGLCKLVFFRVLV